MSRDTPSCRRTELRAGESGLVRTVPIQSGRWGCPDAPSRIRVTAGSQWYWAGHDASRPAQRPTSNQRRPRTMAHSDSESQRQRQRQRQKQMHDTRSTSETHGKRDNQRHTASAALGRGHAVYGRASSMVTHSQRSGDDQDRDSPRGRAQRWAHAHTAPGSSSQYSEGR